MRMRMRMMMMDDDDDDTNGEDDGDDDDDTNEDEDDDDGDDDDGTNEDDDPLPAANLLSGGTRGDRTWACRGSNLKVSGFPTVLACLFLAKARATSASTS